ncbi:MAG: HRDC domain-containing protein [Dehalococcoidia bacterium]
MPPEPGSGPPPAELPADAAPIFEQLRARGAGVAKEQGVPAYVIFHDSTLRAIATAAPATLEALSATSGVGQTKLARYCQQILDTVQPAAADG